MYGVGAYRWISGYSAQALSVSRLAAAVCEAAPFLYSLVGVGCLRVYQYFQGQQRLSLTLAAALMFLVAGFSAWMLRAHRRIDA